MNLPERTPSRDAELAAFLRTAGWPRQAARPLAGDASNRRYLRPGPGRGATREAAFPFRACGL